MSRKNQLWASPQLEKHFVFDPSIATNNKPRCCQRQSDIESEYIPSKYLILHRDDRVKNAE